MKKIIRFLKRARKKNRPKKALPTYDICVVNTSVRGKKVYEKLGFYSASGYARLNVFRLVYWLSRGVRLSGTASMKLEAMNILKSSN